MVNRLTAAVLGASGYAGGELIRILDGHPGFDLIYLGAHQKAGETLGQVHPQLEGGDRPLRPSRPEEVPDCDVAFLSLPHQASAPIGAALADRGATVVDLSADFRFDDPAQYAQAYGQNHPFPEQLDQWVYALPELIDIPTGHKKLAIPGCYPTAVLLAATPFLRAGLARPGIPIVADCLSGVSGAGRKQSDNLLFGSVAEGVQAYGVAGHRHRPEIEMAIRQITDSEQRVVFTPHLLPIQRGLTATVTIATTEPIASDDLKSILAENYGGTPFVDIIDNPPQTRWVSGSNRALVSAFYDAHTQSIISLSAIDNLGKGAAGQAVQAANIALGWGETVGLSVTGNLP